MPARPTTSATLAKLAAERGVDVVAIAAPPAGPALRLAPVRIGIVDVYGGSVTSGWMQWLLTQFAFPFEVVYPPTLDAGNLNARFDVLLFEEGIVPAAGRGESRQAQVDPASLPSEYRARVGGITDAQTLPAIRQFLDQGGAVIAIGSSTSLAARLGLPVAGALVEQGSTRPLPSEKFYIPGSILRARADLTHPLAYGMPETFDIFFNNNPLFRLAPEGGARQAAWFGPEAAVRSGWAWGFDYVKGATAVAEIGVGKGKLLLYGPQIAFRAHPHGTFKMLFNGILYGKAEPVVLGKK